MDASRSKLVSRGSATTSVNLRGVQERNKSHPDGSDNESSSDQGSLRFDQFLDAQGSDEEDEQKKQFRMRRESRKSRASLSQSAIRMSHARDREGAEERGVATRNSCMHTCAGRVL